MSCAVCSVMSDAATSWTVACQAPLSMEFSRQEYWSGLPFHTLGDLPNPGIKPTSLASPALAGGFFTIVPPGKPKINHREGQNSSLGVICEQSAFYIMIIC